MKTISNTEFKFFLHVCTVDYDVYNNETDVAILKDDELNTIARLDFKTDNLSLETPRFYIDEDTEIIPTEEQLDLMYKMLYSEAKGLSEDKQEFITNGEETPYCYLTA